MRLRLSAMLLLLASLAACRTTDEENRNKSETVSVAEEASPVATPVVTPTAPECPPEDVVCGQEEAAAYCTATVYDGRALSDSLVVRAWGANSCEGLVALTKAACAKGYLPSRLGQTQCAPDASGGNCPAATVVCGDEVEPTFCTANRYNEQKLSEAQQLQAWGSNACRAREALAALACRRNLDPRVIGEINCGVDPQAGECPPAETLCTDEPRESACEVRSMVSGVLSQPLEATGDSACEAKQKLSRLICSRGLRPSAVVDVVCRFGK